MFRTKKEVDRHVQDVFRKLKNENERNLRSYNIAKLYYQIGEYETARRYIADYLELRDECSGAHKLLAQILEALGKKEEALNEYITSLELEKQQDNLLLKVCELVNDTEIGLNLIRVRYWLERADRQFPHHPLVFEVKEKILMADQPVNHNKDLEALIASEISARPTNVYLRVKLLKHYIEKKRFEDAYNHALNSEAVYSHRNSVMWYGALWEFLKLLKKDKGHNWSFCVFYVSTFERYAALSLKEDSDNMRNTVSEAMQAVFDFDQALLEFKSAEFSEYSSFNEPMLLHMWGQLHFHLACLLLRIIKREQGTWSDARRICGPLLLCAVHTSPLDPSAAWAIRQKDQLKRLINLWYKEGSYRCSQAGHILQDFCKSNPKKVLEKIEKFYTGNWRERIYQRLFASPIFHQGIRGSYFTNNTAQNPQLRILSQSELEKYDEVSEEVWPESLHHQIWLGLKSRPHYSQNKELGPHPNQTSHIFRDLHFSVYNPNQAAPDTLCRLDIDAFLNAAIVCTAAVLEGQEIGDLLNSDRLPTLPADITKPLCTSAQQKWWTAAYRVYSKQEILDGDIGEIRQELQRGLEVVRCLGNHGLHPAIMVHLARIFQHRGKMLRDKDKEHSDIPALDARCELYWSNVIPLLERMQKNQTIRMTNGTLFNYVGKDMTDTEITNALEEGKLLLTQRFLREKQYEQAIDALQALRCPEASFRQGQIYKSLADEILSPMSRESLTSEMRSQHIIMLSKAKNCFYLTLDRLRSPGTNPNHPLNSELDTHIAEVENELKRIDPDSARSDFSRNDCDGISEESYSSAQSVVEQAVANSALTTIPGLSPPVNMLSTPQRTPHRTPKQTSTPWKLQHQDVLDLSRNRNEARPSPERLDAQIRQLIYTRDNMMQTIVEQNKAVLESNKAIMEKIEELMKDVAELRKESQKQRTQSVNANQTNLEEDLYVLGEEDYNDLSYNAAQQGTAPPLSANMFTPSHRHPYSPLVYPPAPAFQGYYQGGIPFNDPNAQAISSLYASNVYPMPMLYQNRAKVDNILQQSLFPSRLPTQLPDLMAPPNQPFQIPIQKIEPPIVPGNIVPTATMAPGMPSTMIPPPSMATATIPVSTTPTNLGPSSIAPATMMPSVPMTTGITTTTMTSTPSTTVIKDAPVNKTPPVNVVITTSDILPTTAPSVQPVLSVTIPAQHRLGTPSAPGSITATVATTNAPHCYQLSMPPQPTIPTTVNLPSLTTTLTTSSVSIPTLATETSKTGKNTPDVRTVASPNTSAEITEVEHDPYPDFAPVIPLPAEVKVTTGEEDEETLYCARAKLYRFVDQEWKDRGVGNVKFLKNAEGKVRLLMRRDQVLKICANHILTADMELKPVASSEKAWVWVANDFADEEVKLERLAIKFKTAEEATAFKVNFDKAKASLSPSKDVSSNVGEKLPCKVKSTVKTVSFSEKASEQKTIASKSDLSKQDNATSTSAPVITSLDSLQNSATTVGGFSFSTKPKLQPVTSTDSQKPSIKPSEAPKVSPFADFTFSKTALPAGTAGKLSTTTPPQQPSFTFGKQSTPVTASTFSALSTVTTTANATLKNETTVTSTTAPTTATSNSEVRLSELFKPPADSWSCDTCCVRNNGSQNYCVACDSPKDPTAPPKPKTSSFQLDTSGSIGSMPTFTFGIPQNANKDTGGGFTLCLPSANGKASSDIPKSDASSFKVDSGNSTKFVFGTQHNTNTNANKDAQFVFGSPGKSFNFVAKSPVKPSGADEQSEEEVAESEDIDFSPVIPLPDKIDVVTGEENEEVLYSHRAKLFRFDKSVKEWKERGLGDIKLLKHKETGKLRMIMRRDQVLKLCLNHFVLPDLEFTLKDEKTWLWNAADFSNEEIEYNQFACRFKTSEIAQEFKKSVDDAQNNAKSPGGEGKTTKVKSETSSTKVDDTAANNDIEIVYEEEPTEHEINASKELKLPRNFFAYKRKPDCPGCRGCREPEIPLYENTTLPKSLQKSKKSVAIVEKSNAVPVVDASPKTIVSGKSENKLADDNKTINFASILQNTSKQSPDSKEQNFSPENLKICSPSITQTQQITSTTSIPIGQSIFGMPTSAAASGSIQGVSIFGGRATTVAENPFTSRATDENASSASPMKPLFKPSSSNMPLQPTGSSISSNLEQGKPPTDSSTATIPPPATPPTTGFSFSNISTFGTGNSQLNSGAANARSPPLGSNSATSVFGASSCSVPTAFSTKFNFGIGASINAPSGNTNTPEENVAETKVSENGSENVGFLSAPNTTFSMLAAKGPAKEAFKSEPGFSFAGAGSTVFGANHISNVVQQKQETSKKGEDNNDECEGDNDEGEHDPQFAPIIPLPDAIEVRTGEEDEEKVFGERARLYRYNGETKEWKERGIGEMKILHHVERGTYRLLLRREKIHKVVCNFLLSPYVRFTKLSSSECTYVWTGMNHIDGKSDPEQLAVKFKNVDLATKFKRTVDSVQETLQEMRSKGRNSMNPTVEEPDDDHEDEDDDDEDDDDDDDEGEEEEGDGYDEEAEDGEEYANEDYEDNDDEEDQGEKDYKELIVFEKKATLVIKSDEEEKGKPLTGTVTIYYVPEWAGCKIVLKTDKVISETIIQKDMQMQVSKKKCIWTADDYVCQPPVRRTLKAIFSSTHDAEHMMKCSLKGFESSKHE